jgi:hypothetical protein
MATFVVVVCARLTTLEAVALKYRVDGRKVRTEREIRRSAVSAVLAREDGPYDIGAVLFDPTEWEVTAAIERCYC